MKLRLAVFVCALSFVMACAIGTSQSSVEAKGELAPPTYKVQQSWSMTGSNAFVGFKEYVTFGLGESGSYYSVDVNNLLLFWDHAGKRNQQEFAIMPEGHSLVCPNAKRTQIAMIVDGKVTVTDGRGQDPISAPVKGTPYYLDFVEGKINVVSINGLELRLTTYDVGLAVKEVLSKKIGSLKAKATDAVFKRGVHGRIRGLALGKEKGSWLVIDGETKQLRTEHHFNYEEQADVAASPSLDLLAYRKGENIIHCEVRASGDVNESEKADHKEALPLWLVFPDQGTLVLDEDQAVSLDGKFKNQRMVTLLGAESTLVERVKGLHRKQGLYTAMLGNKFVFLPADSLDDKASTTGGVKTGLLTNTLPVFFATSDGSYIFHQEVGKDLRVISMDDQGGKVQTISDNDGTTKKAFSTVGVRLAPWFSKKSPHILIGRQKRLNMQPFKIVSLETGEEIMRDYKGKQYPKYYVWLKTPNFLSFLPNNQVLMKTGHIYNWKKLKDVKRRKVELIRVVQGVLDADHGLGFTFLTGDKKTMIRVSPNTKKKVHAIRKISVKKGETISTVNTNIKVDTDLQSVEANWYAKGIDYSGELVLMAIDQNMSDGKQGIGVLSVENKAMQWTVQDVSSSCAPIITRDGKYVAAANKKGQVIVYGATDGKKVAILDTGLSPRGLAYGGNGLFFAADGTDVVSVKIK